MKYATDEMWDCVVDGEMLLRGYHEPVEQDVESAYMMVVSWTALKVLMLDASFGDKEYADAVLDGTGDYSLEYVTCDGCDRVELMWAFTQREEPLFAEFWTLTREEGAQWWDGTVEAWCVTCSE